ncbi:MAG: hypothetical protein KDD53_08645 [Bdellovibrionales bacterium]|nr:hypothetical protein [Bdellovibrionales bacterium]
MMKSFTDIKAPMKRSLLASGFMLTIAFALPSSDLYARPLSLTGGALISPNKPILCQRELNQCLADNESLSEEILDLSTQLLNLQNENASLYSDLLSVNSEVSELQTELATCQNQVSSANDGLVSLQSELLEAQNQLNVCNQENEDLSDKIASLQNPLIDEEPQSLTFNFASIRRLNQIARRIKRGKSISEKSLIKNIKRSRNRVKKLGNKLMIEFDINAELQLKKK